MKRPSITIDRLGGEPAATIERLEAAVAAALRTGPVSPPSTANEGAPGRSIRRGVPSRGAPAAALEDAELSVTLVPADYIRNLNRDYHGVDVETDVLAFRLGGDGPLAGDVYVCTDVAAQSAHELGIAVEEEILRLVIHGVLHILGHEHPEGPDRAESTMFALQERLLEEILEGG